MVGCVLLVGCGSASTESTGSGNKVQPVAATNQPSETNSAKPGEKTKNLSRVFQTADLEVLKITLNGKPFELWIMDTSDKCREGMMFLEDKEVRDDQGMIFAFKEVLHLCQGLFNDAPCRDGKKIFKIPISCNG